MAVAGNSVICIEETLYHRDEVSLEYDLPEPEEVCRELPPRLRTLATRILRSVAKGKIPLPVLPEHAAQALAVAQSIEPSFRDFERVIRQDTILTTKLLKIANSPFYGASQEVSSIRQAMLMLGTTALSQMLMQVVVEAHTSSNPNDARLLAREQEHATYIAHLAQAIAQHANQGTPQAFLSGLVHDFGRIVFPSVIRSTGIEADEEILRPMVDVIHGRLGFYVASAWNLPLLVREATLRHHDYEANGENSFLRYSPVGNLVAAAESLARDLGLVRSEESASQPDSMSSASETLLSLTPPEQRLETPQLSEETVRHLVNMGFGGDAGEALFDEAVRFARRIRGVSEQQPAAA